VSSDLTRTLKWALPAIAGVSLLFWTLATAEPMGPRDAEAAELDVARADIERTLPALARQASAERTAATLSEETAATAPERRGPVTGFALPRYVSIGASEANARRGPSRSHRIDWVFTRRGMPVMIVAEHGHWRRVVDRDGVGGWMHYSLLSGVRSAIVQVDMLALHSRPDASSPVRARAELGVIGRLRECRPDWCLMETGGYRGWVDPRALWGVEPGEVFD
jgi:SH3-like domain-containing protein